MGMDGTFDGGMVLLVGEIVRAYAIGAGTVVRTVVAVRRRRRLHVRQRLIVRDGRSVLVLLLLVLLRRLHLLAERVRLADTRQFVQNALQFAELVALVAAVAVVAIRIVRQLLDALGEQRVQNGQLLALIDVTGPVEDRLAGWRIGAR